MTNGQQKARLIFSVLIAFFSGPAVGAQPSGAAKIGGKVRAQGSGRPVNEAIVRIFGPPLAGRQNSEMYGHPKPDGTYAYSVPPGIYNLSVTASGFDSQATEISLTSGESRTHDFELRPKVSTGAYRVEAVKVPRRMIAEVSGVAFTPMGTLVALTRRGEVWMREAGTEKWRRFARGLHPDAFGLHAESERTVYVTQRPELTQLVDTDGNGEADWFRTLNDDWGMTGNYHEFTYGLARDRHGNFYGGNGMASREANNFQKTLIRGNLSTELRVPGDTRDPHRSVTDYQGWIYQIDAAGAFVPFASGFRQPFGIGLSPNDELFATDISGFWMPTSVLFHVEKGRFYGNPEGLKWDPNFSGKKLTIAELLQMRTPPVVYLPRGPLGSSAGQPVWDTTGGKFGPFHGQIFLGDWTGLIIRVDLEKVAGEYQGVAFPFLHGEGLRVGGVRGAFAPDGSLYLGQTMRGWAPATGEGIQRIVWTNVTPVEIQTVRLMPGGFSIGFTTPMDPEAVGNPAIYRVRRFKYHYQIDDGSLQTEEANVPLSGIAPHASGLGVSLALLELLPDYIYEIKIESLKSRDGRPLANPLAYYTANRLLAGQRPATPSKIVPIAEASDAPPDWREGEKIFSTTCVVCHQKDGRGSQQVGTPDFTGAAGPLHKSDQELIAKIMAGGQVMPAFGNVLRPREIRNVLAYVRKEFGGRSPSKQ